MQVQIKFIVGGANSICGGFSAGDTLRCSEAMAKHLVDDVKCAKYMEAPAEAAPKADAPVKDKPKPVKRQKAKE